jgi:hypothetical protein
MEKLAAVALMKHDVKEARTCFELAHKYRTNKNEEVYSPEMLAPPTFLVTSNINEIGNFEKRSMKEIGGKFQTNQYKMFIDNIKDISPEDKQKLYDDAGIEQ